jgi:hypothetical protein
MLNPIHKPSALLLLLRAFLLTSLFAASLVSYRLVQ